MKLWLCSLLMFALVAPTMASVVSINTERLPNGKVNNPYFAIIKASGGCTPYVWSVVSGSRPASVKKQRSTSTTSLDLTGTPTIAATYSFTVSVTGCGGHVSKRSYRVTIQPAADHVVHLSWEPSTSKDIAGYNIYRGPNGSTWGRLTLVWWLQHSTTIHCG